VRPAAVCRLPSPRPGLGLAHTHTHPALAHGTTDARAGPCAGPGTRAPGSGPRWTAALPPRWSAAWEGRGRGAADAARLLVLSESGCVRWSLRRPRPLQHAGHAPTGHATLVRRAFEQLHSASHGLEH
jgi:hypothetical protein